MDRRILTFACHDEANIKATEGGSAILAPANHDELPLLVVMFSPSSS
jgi:hypothetical protein